MLFRSVFRAPKVIAATLGYFRDAEVAFVQTPQDFYNLDSYQHRWGKRGRSVWTEQSLFFRVIQRGKDWWNAAFFCGSCALIRRSALNEIGGFATGTVTEDLHTSLRIHARGWRSVYHAEPLAFGIAPESIKPFLSQRVRWGQGAMHVWRSEGILLHKGLTWGQRLNYFASVLTYFDGWQKGFMYVAPLVVLVGGLMPMKADGMTFLMFFVPYMVMTLWMFEEVARGYGRTLMIEQYNMARFAAFAWATMAWFIPPNTFKVTRKGGRAEDGLLRLTSPQATVLALNVLGLVGGWLIFYLQPTIPTTALLVCSCWALVNASLALGVITFTQVTQRNRRNQYRFPVSLPARVKIGDNVVTGTVDDLSERGLRFYGDIPAEVHRAMPLACALKLPEGEVTMVGEIRTLERHPQGPGYSRMGLAIRPDDLVRNRIEHFLYGSDLQWVLHGYTDRVHTPLSWLWPSAVNGPKDSPFGSTPWISCAAQIGGHGPKKWLLLSASPDRSRPAYVISHDMLPSDRAICFHPFGRRHNEAFWGVLTRLEVDGPGGTPARVMTYQLAHAAAPGYSAEEAREARESGLGDLHEIGRAHV